LGLKSYIQKASIVNRRLPEAHITASTSIEDRANRFDLNMAPFPSDPGTVLQPNVGRGRTVYADLTGRSRLM